MHLSLRLLFIFSTLALAFSIPTNVSVDDSFPDPLTGKSIQYFPEGGSVASGNWQAGQDCNITSGCTAVLDVLQLFNGTYRYGEANTDSEATQAASFLFSGTAVYVMCIWASVAPSDHIDSLSNSDMTFSLNDTVVGNFSKKANISKEHDAVYNYGTPVYVNENLPSGAHNLLIQNGLAGRESVIMLDRIIYTTEVEGTTEASPIPSTGTNTSAVHLPLSVPPKHLPVGGIIAGGVGSVVLLCSIVIWYRRRRAVERKRTNIVITPFETPPAYGVWDATLVKETHPPEYASQADELDTDIRTGSRASIGTDLWMREKDRLR